MVEEGLLGCGKSSRIGDVCPRCWWGSELDGDPRVEARWDLGRWECGLSMSMGDGGPVGADFDGMELVGDGLAWIAPAHLDGPTMKCWMCTLRSPIRMV